MIALWTFNFNGSVNLIYCFKFPFSLSALTSLIVYVSSFILFTSNCTLSAILAIPLLVFGVTFPVTPFSSVSTLKFTPLIVVLESSVRTFLMFNEYVPVFGLFGIVTVTFWTITELFCSSFSSSWVIAAVIFTVVPSASAIPLTVTFWELLDSSTVIEFEFPTEIPAPWSVILFITYFVPSTFFPFCINKLTDFCNFI